MTTKLVPRFSAAMGNGSCPSHRLRRGCGTRQQGNQSVKRCRMKTGFFPQISVRTSNWVLKTTRDNTARLGDAATGKQIGEPMRHNDLVTSAKFSPDGQRVLTASTDNTARLWDFPTTSSKDGADELSLLADLAESIDAVTIQTSGQTEILHLMSADQVRAMRENIAGRFLSSS